APLRSFTPLNWVVLLMRSMLFRIASVWSWLAWISSGERAPVLAAWLVRLWTWSRSELTSLRAPSAVLRTLPARWELSMAWLMPVISERSVSLAMRPAGASLPEVIFRPLERRGGPRGGGALFFFLP